MFGKVESLEKLKNGMEMTFFTRMARRGDIAEVEEIVKNTGVRFTSMFFTDDEIQNIVEELDAAGLLIYLNEYQQYIYFDSIINDARYRVKMEYNGLVYTNPETDMDEVEFIWEITVFERDEERTLPGQQVLFSFLFFSFTRNVTYGILFT